jgi:hypothetical protein
MENENKSPDYLPDVHPGDNNMDQYNAYQRYEKAYNDKMNGFVAAYASAQNNPAELEDWASIGAKYMDEINTAMQEWEELGFKKEIDAILDVVDLELNLEPEEEK